MTDVVLQMLKLKAAIKDFDSCRQRRANFPSLSSRCATGMHPGSLQQGSGVKPRTFEAISAAPVLHHTSTTSAELKFSLLCFVFSEAAKSHFCGSVGKVNRSVPFVSGGWRKLRVASGTRHKSGGASVFEVAAVL